MGSPNDRMVPAAILYSNPGITREEFVDLLNKVRVFNWWMSADKPWNYLENEQFEDWRYHQGLHGLAEILNLGQREATPPVYDSHHLPLDPPHLSVCARKKGQGWGKPSYEVFLHVKNKIKKKIVCELSASILQVDEIRYFEECGQARVLDIQSRTSNGPWSYEYSLLLQPFEKSIRQLRFSSLEQLIRQFPEYNPDYRYDFSQKEGVLFSGGIGKDNFRWIQGSGRYFLDPQTFDNIHA